MTWTLLYIDSNNKLLYKSVNAPHGEGAAWDYILCNFELNPIAIVPGNHSVFSKRKLNTATESTTV